ncbi:lipopolysaccharide biosynthesis protein [Pseudothauera lacus]|uniref:Polysaccharide biosynthesis protein n=1 Tax=Pseudothauera lacus TaxID=2136175 RepID=A0A2T4IK25_9RHOO|nr:oligosaccharide flippase family protein [Pseudothauera lacus]PTD98124.1 hypothetical protein C8261_01530 [Pseudothauera lacus]
MTASAYSAGQVRRSLVHFAFGKSASALMGVGLLLLLVRALDVADYGFYLASQAALELVAMFSSFGLIAVAQRYLPELRARQQGRQLARLIAVLCVARLLTLAAVCVALYFLATWLAAALGLNAYTAAIRLFLLVIVVEGLARFLDEVFDSLMMQGVAQLSIVLRTGLRLGLGIALFGAADATLALATWIFIELAASAVACVVALVLLTRTALRIRRSVPGEDERLPLRRFFNYAAPTFLAGSLYTLSGPNVVKLVGARVLSASQFAAFGFAAAFAAMLQRYLPMFLLIRMVRPLFVAARQREDYRQRLPAMGALVFKLNAFALVPVAAFLAVAGVETAVVLTGGRYPEAGAYLLAFLVVLLAQALRAVSSLIAQAMENARAPLVGTSLGLIGLALGVLLSGSLGAYGLCVGLVVSEAVFALYVRRALTASGLSFVSDGRAYLRMLISAVLAAFCGLVLMRVLPPDGPLALGVTALSVAGSFLVFAFFIKPFTPEERGTLNRLLKREVFVW